MNLSNVPCWGSFTFIYKGISIYVPSFLNNVARYKPDSFWDWLIYTKYPGQTAVAFVYENIGEEETWSKNICLAKQASLSASSVSQYPVLQDEAPPTEQYLH